MIHQHKTLVKSRENLQAICQNRKNELKKYIAFDSVLSNVWLDIQPLITSSVPMTKRVINLNATNYQFLQSFLTSEFIEELIEVLQKEYPGVGFTYIESRNNCQEKTDRIIIMDWS